MSVIAEIPTTTAKKFNLELGMIGNPKRRNYTLKAVTLIKEEHFNDKKYLWMAGDAYIRYSELSKASGIHRTENTVLEVETNAKFLYIKYYSGSWSNTYDNFEALYDVEKEQYVLRSDLQKDEISRLRLEMLDKGYAVSKEDECRNIFAYYLLKQLRSNKNENIEKAKQLIKEAISLIGIEKVKELLDEVRA